MLPKCKFHGHFNLTAFYDLLHESVNFFTSLLFKTNRFYVAMHLFRNISQKMSKCGKNMSDTRAVTFLFLPNFDVICDHLLNKMHSNMESIC